MFCISNFNHKKTGLPRLVIQAAFILVYFRLLSILYLITSHIYALLIVWKRETDCFPFKLPSSLSKLPEFTVYIKLWNIYNSLHFFIF